MKKALFAVLCLALGAALVATEAEARRLGGGRSIGMQRSVTPAPSSTPARPAQQQAAPGSQQAAPAQAAPQGAAAQPAPSGLSRWLPMLGGLAIGGLLGSLFSGSGLGGILLLALLAFGAVALVKALARRGESPRPAQLAGADSRSMALGEPLPSGAADVRTAGPASVPAGFDTASFLKGAKTNFLKLQLANDLGRLEDIREFTTTEMYEALSREPHEPGQQTDVSALDADLLEVATEGDKYWASVRFSGTVREAPGAAPEGFQEVWNLVKPRDGSSGWLLAGIQQMH